VAALVLSLVRTTEVPPCGAAEARVTVPVTGVPPTTVLELSVTPETAGPVAAGVTASVKDRVAEPWEAVMSAEVLAGTELVATVNVAVLAPSATVTLAGTVATEVLPLERVTTIPPAVAGAVNVTVPVEEEPPTTERGFRLRLERVGVLEFTVKTADLDTPPALAVMTEELLPAVVPAWIVNVAPVCPPATVTLSGTVAAVALPLESATISPPAGAGPVSATVPVLVEPSTTALGLRPRLESEAEAGGGGGGGVELTVQPDRRAVVAVADPSLTSMVQSAGAVKPVLEILNLPDPSLVPMATPSTVIALFARAWPSTLSCVPPSSARETLTAACAIEAARSVPTTMSIPIAAKALINGRKASGGRPPISIPQSPKRRFSVLLPSWRPSLSSRFSQCNS
jgi:hypothetical protein